MEETEALLLGLSFLKNFDLPGWVFPLVALILSCSSPNGTIAQLGERAIEVRKVAGSIPARPIFFDIFIIRRTDGHLSIIKSSK